MSIAKYKALKDFEFNDEDLIKGEERVLEDGEAKESVELGQFQLVKYLDPDDKLDAIVIKAFDEAEKSAASNFSEREKVVADVIARELANTTLTDLEQARVDRELRIKGDSPKKPIK